MSACKRVFTVGFGPGLDSMSPARSWRSASHATGSHDWLPKKLGARAPERQDKVDTICTVPIDCGTPTTRRLYPFGALPLGPQLDQQYIQIIFSIHIQCLTLDLY